MIAIRETDEFGNETLHAYYGGERITVLKEEDLRVARVIAEHDVIVAEANASRAGVPVAERLEKIRSIKQIRAELGCGLADAKELYEKFAKV